jgi:uncharacterized protein with HEPN domain
VGPEPVKQLTKILTHARNAHGFVEGTDVRAFHSDLMRRSAVVGQMIALGLAIKGLSDETKAKLPEVPWSRLEAMADSLVRDYDDAGPDVILETATQVVPQVIRAVSSFVGQNPDSQDEGM